MTAPGPAGRPDAPAAGRAISPTGGLAAAAADRQAAPGAVRQAAPAAGRGTAPARPPWRGVLAEYQDWLPDVPADAVVTLGEGGTPLIAAPELSRRTGCQVFLKIEGTNPTGSFKDRGMTVAVSLAAAAGARCVICASTGNTSASAAAYAARAGLSCAVLLPAGSVAAGKLAQAHAYGARILQVAGTFDDCLRLSRALAGRHQVALVNSVNPHRLEGQKTAAFEVVDALGDAPDVHCLPVGNAGNISAYWMGYQQYLRGGRASRAPRMLGFQACGAAPLVTGTPVAEPATVASAIRIGNPASWQLAVRAAAESGGGFAAVPDEEIMAASRLLARREGVFGEPASAAGVAGLLAASQDGRVRPGSVVVCTITGAGLKDTEAAVAGAAEAPEIDPDPAAAAAALRLDLA